MRLKFTLPATALSIASLLFPGLAQLKENNAAQGKQPVAPAAGVFRVVLNGFKVNHESDDDILEGDGKRDEVYLRADVWVLNRNGSVPYRRSPRSVVMGDINNQSDPPRIRAGTASDMGGLRTNDKWPINEPWRRVRNPLPDRPPMLLWEGELVQGGNMTVIIPTVWDWDSRDPSDSEINWDKPGGVSSLFDDIKPSLQTRITSNSRDLLYQGYEQLVGEKGGTRPIGIRRGRSAVNGRVTEEYSWYYVTPAVLVLTYDAALQAVRSTPSGVGYGVIALNYVDQYDHGDYTLYVQVEQIK